MTAKRTPSNRLPLLLPLLLALGIAPAAAAAATRDVAMHGPNGDGGSDCSATEDVAPVPAAASSAKAAKPPAKAPATTVKAFVPLRGGDDGGTHAPRWHSFLPGMFR